MCLSFLVHVGYWPVLCEEMSDTIWMLLRFCNLLCPWPWGHYRSGQLKHLRIFTQGNSETRFPLGVCWPADMNKYTCIWFPSAFPRWQWTSMDLSSIFELEKFSFNFISPFGILFLIQELLLCKIIIIFRFLICWVPSGHHRKGKGIVIFCYLNVSKP